MPQRKVVMTKTDIVESLKKEAKDNPVFSAVAHVFAVRQRARQEVTMKRLLAKMKAEGFSYTESDYSPVLKFLAHLGFGRLETNAKGQVLALRDIKTTLQSIGAVACGEKGKLQSFNKRHQFGRLIDRPKAVRKNREQLPKVEESPTVFFSVTLKGKPVKVELSSDMTSEEIADLISAFRTVKS